MATSPTLRLLRDELVGFARSRVMIVLWVVLPLLAILGYLLFTSSAEVAAGMGGDHKMSANAFMTFLLSSLAGTVAALMVAVDIVSERTRKVYELYVIRPIRREAIIWAKFLAVAACVVVACVVAIALGIAVDVARGDPFTATIAYDALKGLASLTAVVSLSAAVGTFFGVISRTILVAVILVLYVGQNLTIVPMLPMYFGILPRQFWVIMAISYALVAVMAWLSAVVFRRSQF